MYKLERQKAFSYPGDVETFTSGVRLTNYFNLKFLGVWHEVLKNGKRSSWPHAHRLEEELVIILKGTGQVWLNGYIQSVKPGDCVYFKSGTNVAHTLLNESSETIEYLGIGEANVDNTDEKIIYPLHEERNSWCQQNNILWIDAPPVQKFGNHLAIPTNEEIRIEEINSPQEFLEKTGDFLYKNEAEYGLMLGLTELKVKNPTNETNYKYFWLNDADGFSGAAVFTEKLLVVSAMPASMLKSLSAYLYKRQINLPGVIGPSHSAESFARIYSQSYKTSPKLVMDQKIYQLDHVIPPRHVDGEVHVATHLYHDLATSWLLKFIEESVPEEPSSHEEAQKIIDKKIENQELFVYLNHLGQPVALNMIMRPTRNGIAISFVYTPPEHRQKGYASALVANTSQRMLDAGKKFCVLYTDAKNPTSNGIYKKIGYKQIATSKKFAFTI